MHKNRTWCLADAASAEGLAAQLTGQSWTLCTAFRLGGYLFVNDATSENGAQEYAVVKELPDGGHVQVESITFSWCSPDRALDLIRRALAGAFDTHDFARPVRPNLETPDQHRRQYCHLCA